MRQLLTELQAMTLGGILMGEFSMQIKTIYDSHLDWTEVQSCFKRMLT